MIFGSDTTPTQESDLPPSQFTTRAQMAERQGTAKRMAWAVAMAGLALLAFILLGPDEQTIKDKFEYYGVPDEMKIMPELSIDNGQDQVHQIPKSLMTPPPPSSIEIEPEDLSETGTDLVPEMTEEPIKEVIVESYVPTPDAEIASKDQVELNLPQQSNPDYFIKKQVNPEYPMGASEAELRTPIIFVKVAIFVNLEGQVTDAMVQATNGSKLFADEVVKCVLQWEIGYRIEPESGRWLTMTWNFNSPFFTGGR